MNNDMRINLLVFGFIFVFSTLYAQGDFEGIPKEKYNGTGIIYNNEFSVDITKQTKGYSFGVYKGKILTFYKTRYAGLQLAEFKHHKEYKLSLNNSDLTESVIYGKQNSFYGLRAVVGEKKYFTEKSKTKGVAVGLNYNIGFNLGIAKPYYVLIRNFDQRSTAVKYNESNASEFLNTSLMRGAAPWSIGLDELGFYPGGTAKIAVHVDWGAFDEYIKGVEAGLVLDVFPKQIPIMVPLEGVENRKYFINLFITLQLGKRS
jgi:hypothetical protein